MSHKQSQLLLYFGVGIPQGPLLVPQVGLLSSRHFGDVSFTLSQSSVLDSFADQYSDVVVQLFLLVRTPRWAPIFATAPFLRCVGFVASRLLSKPADLSSG